MATSFYIHDDFCCTHSVFVIVMYDMLLTVKDIIIIKVNIYTCLQCFVFVTCDPLWHSFNRSATRK